ncbi:hypothetical protein PIB30_004607 [Stylosanthes scabra]|uniref:Uncharacterized protein n=1 Tax=Stylosanthes scabra TaxID=79078 RepID=A0ABU6Z1I4_9FABA|nr:hypothetical protein [Stylosanthes scabra]
MAPPLMDKDGGGNVEGSDAKVIDDGGAKNDDGVTVDGEKERSRQHQIELPFNKWADVKAIKLVWNL